MEKKGKYEHKGRIAALFALAILVILVLAITMILWLNRAPEEPLPSTDGNPPETSDQTDTGLSHEPSIDYELPTAERPDPMQICEGLRIEEIGSYVGIYMEDGSDEIVSDVMMVILSNTGEQDLQLMQLQLVYEDLTAEFEASNVPAGERIVLLEKNRAPVPQGELQSVETGHVIFFPEPMSLYADQFEITGGKGYLDVKNISGEDVSGLIRVFYKNASQDLLYGGITYMATLQDGIPAGETVRIMTSHFSDSGSRIIHVVCGE